MTKHAKIGLMLLVTVVLLLTLVLPGFAKKDESYQCYITTLVVNKGGNYLTEHILYGDLEAYWVDNTLYNYCTGKVPFGEPIDTGEGLSFATFDEVCKYYGDLNLATCSQNELYTDSSLWQENIVLYNPDEGSLLDATYYDFTVHKNGKFLFYKEYTMP